VPRPRPTGAAAGGAAPRGSGTADAPVGRPRPGRDGTDPDQHAFEADALLAGAASVRHDDAYARARAAVRARLAAATGRIPLPDDEGGGDAGGG
jgi:hypothetical protein